MRGCEGRDARGKNGAHTTREKAPASRSPRKVQKKERCEGGTRARQTGRGGGKRRKHLPVAARSGGSLLVRPNHGTPAGTRRPLPPDGVRPELRYDSASPALFGGHSCGVRVRAGGSGLKRADAAERAWSVSGTRGRRDLSAAHWRI